MLFNSPYRTWNCIVAYIHVYYNYKTQDTQCRLKTYFMASLVTLQIDLWHRNLKFPPRTYYLQSGRGIIASTSGAIYNYYTLSCIVILLTTRVVDNVSELQTVQYKGRRQTTGILLQPILRIMSSASAAVTRTETTDCKRGVRARQDSGVGQDELSAGYAEKGKTCGHVLNIVRTRVYVRSLQLLSVHTLYTRQ